MLVFRARCCSPIQGERIIGYITRGKGVSVHSVNCPNVTNLLFDPERRIEVEWAKGDGPAVYTQRLTLEADDRKGILADVTASPRSTPTFWTSRHAPIRRAAPRSR